MAHQFTTSYLADSLTLLRYYKSMAEKAIAQVTDQQLTETLDPEANSIAVIVKHPAGNMRSRWMDFLTTDGEKPDRHRDTEFENAPKTRAELAALWEKGWKYVFDALEPLTDADLTRQVTIRGEPYSVMQAISRQLAHYAHHVGQIVYVAKHLTVARTGKWESLSIPRGKSAETIGKVARGEVSHRATLFGAKKTKR